MHSVALGKFTISRLYSVTDSRYQQMDTPLLQAEQTPAGALQCDVV